ncbi:MAG: SRPBCC family protein [Ardenticatenaceae bacterium]|nr:SRPBCC family protein [Ardenticatenaceae bacterium]
MSSNEYHFITHWQLPGSIDEVFDILDDALDLKRWWPSVYLDVQEVEPGDPQTGIGKVISLYTKGWLPYTLRWQFRVTEARTPHTFTIEAWGDFVGRGIWTLEQTGDITHVTYDWKISAEKPLLRIFSPIMKPIFSANHHWAMQKGEESIKLELLRRRAATPAERATVPPPPPATFPNGRTLLTITGAALAGLGLYSLLRRKNRS